MEAGVNQGQATRGVYYVRQGQATQSGASGGGGRGRWEGYPPVGKDLREPC